MFEIIYRPTGEIGYFILKPEFALLILAAICFGIIIGYFIKNKKNRKSESSEVNNG